jgi:flagellar basal body P-ring protein FlgI
LLLREIRSTSLTNIMNDAIEVELNLVASGNIKLQIEDKKEKDKEEALPSTSQASDAKLDLMVKTMEKLVEKLSLDNKPAKI